PIPISLPAKLGELVEAYVALLDSSDILNGAADQLPRLLAQIDATLLEAYDLPLRLERQLLAFFEDSERPVSHHWQHWDSLYPVHGLSLSERASGRFNPGGDWVRKIFQPLPEDQISVLRDYVV
ncbi:MAG: hypothetical protein KKB63_13500, partial [Alphaproteobacteria bacterium]|nr:hypothetical protein [Alphaproteobacteria bacterium]